MIFGVVFCSQGRAADFYHTGNSVFYGVSDRSGDYLICDAGAQRTFSGLVLPVDSACGTCFPMVLCAQVFFVGSLVRFVFRMIFTKQLANG